MLAQEAARAQGGQLPLPMLLAPAINHARNGYTVTRSQARLTAEKLPEMDKAVGFKKAFLLDGKPPDADARLRQTEFAETLDHLAHAGLDDFYRGDVGREIAGDLERIGSPVTRADLNRRGAAQRPD
jgi:gamma-glutamyltranspeptidase/glutathione hydrolase